MIALLDNGQDLSECEAEIGVPVGQLLTPLTRYRLREPARPWAIDNGCYSGLRPDAFTKLLNRERHRIADAKFVCAPDVVGHADLTLMVFKAWEPILSWCPLAFVCQDGQMVDGVPWDSIAAIFIGGTTEWKDSRNVEPLISSAQRKGKWVHIGRVNEPVRFCRFELLGADSCDGSGIARYSHMRLRIAERACKP